MEYLIEDLVEAWVVFKPEVLAGPVFSRVKVPLADFLGMSEADRITFLVSEVQRDLKLDLKSGATKFEKLLGAVGLDGPVDQHVRDALYEMQNIRNVWAHRGGVADRRLVEACPSLAFSEGEEVNIGTSEYGRYRHALVAYVGIVFNLCQKVCGLDPVAYDLPGLYGVVGGAASPAPM
ncbi:hypothetical protein [Streptomyces sp. NBC_00103]|uniref:hypothetical protein n=1 Tax=Streptomyces sp. NBC_00103 TaxID=2975653 RepID=UPI00225A20E3|nr:hypothetical protein [Streptomyces sp. NBC_00103]MCX5370310.1 hypothetical protein [Streptomyces sp. NBC_00103]